MIINKARVFFIVNSFNEIVVIQTFHDEIGSVIKRKLNYKTFNSKDMLVNKVYTLPISFEKE